MDLPADHSRRQLLVIDARYGIPPWVKQAEVLETPDQAMALQDTEFADPMLRQLPITTAANTWLSAAYFNEHRTKYSSDQRDYIQGNLRRAARIHGIDEDVEQVFATPEPKRADAEDDLGNYCQVVRDGGRVVKLGFPVFDHTGLTQACDYLRRYRDRYKFAEAHEIAKNIVRRANDLDGGIAMVPDRVLKMAGAGVVELHQLVEELEHLANNCPNEKVAMSVRELIIGLADSADYATDAAMQVKLAETVESIQEAVGFGYDNHQFPEELVWGLSIKQAQAMTDDAVTLHKNVYSVTKLAELGPGVFAVLGDDFVLDITADDGGTNRRKLAAVLPTLPLPDKKILEAHLQSTFA